MCQLFSCPRSITDEIAEVRAGYMSLSEFIAHNNRDVRKARQSKARAALLTQLQGWFVVIIWIMFILVVIATPPILMA